MPRVSIILVLMPLAVACQTPVISSLVNPASYQPTLGDPGSILTLFGTNLATASAAAQGLPLPLELAGTSVRARPALPKTWA